MFDGKRRYEARLSNPSRVDASDRSDLAANGSEMTNNGGSSASGREAHAAGRKGGESVLDLDGRNERKGDHGRHQLKSTEIAISVAQESEQVVGPALQNPVPDTVECRLTLVAREVPKDLRGASKRSEIKENGKPAPVEPSGQAAVDPIYRQKQGGLSDEIAASDRLADSYYCEKPPNHEARREKLNTRKVSKAKTCPRREGFSGPSTARPNC